MQFSELGLDPRILRAIEHLGFNSVTEIQEKAIPVAMTGKDLIASSKTGSGKTLAYLLPLMQRLLRVKALSRRDPRAIILAPTRELAKQVYSELRLLLSVTQGRGLLLTGGENFNDQAKQLRRNPQVIVATPGRLADHLLQRHLFLEGSELLIFDEADRMLDLGFAAQLKIIDQAAKHRKRQTLLFSATLDNIEMNQIAMELMHEPERIAVGEGFKANADIRQTFYLVDDLNHKEKLLHALLSTDDFGQAIVFTATREDTSRLAEQIREWGLTSEALSGELIQSKRNQIMDRFARGHQQVLVTTDLASRGLDIVQVGLVINFDLPKHAEEYIHRIGRTGRAGRKGLSCSLIGPKDWKQWLVLQQYLSTSIEYSVIDGLEGHFKGLKAPSNRCWGNRQENRPQPASPKKPKAHKPVKRNRTFHSGVDIGDQPLKKKAPGQSSLPIDDDEE
ncbi:MAG: ATP-dependent RNA helicase RhlE [Candidatus Celerinatantimonas neptuna]|nr:MAG: ATP-dependent RNA helicase RhlE [Candidatus Celerinatantimonas neptuna]